MAWLRKLFVLFYLILCSCSVLPNDKNNNLILSYSIENRDYNYDVYHIKIIRVLKDGENLEYTGLVTIIDGKFTQNENLLHSSKDTCSIKNYFPNNPDDDGYIKEIRCDDMSDMYYLRIIGNKLVIEKE